jgi:hypothetical protein
MPRGSTCLEAPPTGPFIWTIEAARVLAGWVSLMNGLAPILDQYALKRTLDRIRCNGQETDKPHLLIAHGTEGPVNKVRF